MAQPNMQQVAQALNTLGEQILGRLGQIDARFDEVMARMDYCNRLAHARALNSSAILANYPLYPLPLPNGGNIPPEEFPATRAVFLDLSGVELTPLIQRYELPDPGNEVDRRQGGNFWAATPMNLFPCSDCCAREMHSNVSTSTLPITSSESGAFPLTPIKADMILFSPQVIISRPLDGKLWEASSESGRSLRSESDDSQTTVWSGEVQGRRALDLEPGAPLFDPSARLFGDARRERDRNRSWGAPAPPSVTGTTPRRRYHTAGEDDSKDVFVQRRAGSRSPPKERKVKRVPVPPIPNELLEEHNRQLMAKAGRGDLAAEHIVELVSASREVSPPPGLGFEGRVRQFGPKRLLGTLGPSAGMTNAEGLNAWTCPRPNHVFNVFHPLNMAQPNMQQIAQAFNMLGEQPTTQSELTFVSGCQLPLFANHPLVNGLDQILGRLDQIDARLGQVEGRLGQVEARLDEVVARMDY
ncbi:hypothetical protein FRC10_006774 [Ceratobasidium sp. 414]|nr:hypothetical protein FRC10_006774 [Ceratobasidium sp. 414]